MVRVVGSYLKCEGAPLSWGTRTCEVEHHSEVHGQEHQKESIHAEDPRGVHSWDDRLS